MNHPVKTLHVKQEKIALCNVFQKGLKKETILLILWSQNLTHFRAYLMKIITTKQFGNPVSLFEYPSIGDGQFLLNIYCVSVVFV